MKTICSSGNTISIADKKALEEYLVETADEWTLSALKGLINKAVKKILKDWFGLYKSKHEEGVSADIAVIIPGIIAMEEFTPYDICPPQMPIVERKQSKDQPIWQGGFNVEDFEKQALDAYYKDPEEMLRYFMENKIYQRKKAFEKEYQEKLIRDPSISIIPSKVDDLIEFVTTRAGYKNRIDREQI
jgi:hypothetical protein